MLWGRRTSQYPERPFLRFPRLPDPRPARALLALLQAAVRVGMCKLLGHRFRELTVPVPVAAFERFGSMPHYGSFRLMFENTVRAVRMVHQPPTETRCCRCFVAPPLPTATIARRDSL